MILLTLMAITTLGIIRLRNLFSAVILSTIYSFLMASLLLVFDAVDVALTEAAVGAGISTVLMICVLHYTKTQRFARTPYLASVFDFHLVNTVTRASKLMVKCSQASRLNHKNFITL